jgi:hypothetical protein
MAIWLIVDAATGNGRRGMRGNMKTPTVWTGEAAVELDHALGAEMMRLNRPHWYRRQADGSVVRKTLVHLSTDKTSIAADGSDAATVTHDAGAQVAISINGSQELDDEGVKVTADHAGPIRIEVSPDDPDFYADDMAASPADGGPLLINAVEPEA